MIKILNLLLTSLIHVIINPVFWAVIFIIYLQYKKIGKMELLILGRNKESTIKRVFNSVIIGIISGVLGSIIIILIGITVENNDFLYVFILAILLMFIHPRFLCFSYSGGIVALISLIFGYPKINVSSIMAIVAVLHLIESFLIAIDGDKSKIPIYAEKGDTIVGGFRMVRFWPIPFVVLLASSQSLKGIDSSMSNWWPLIGTDNIRENLFYIIVPVVAILGYGDMAISDYPKNKVKQSAKNLFIYSVTLLFLSVVSTRIYIFKIIAALFSPIVHEFLIQLGKKKEKRNKPVFVSSNKGVKILDVMPNGIADKIKLEPGDIIYKINDRDVKDKSDINEILSYFPPHIKIEYYDIALKIHVKEYKDYKNKIRNLGILAVPKQSEYIFITKEAERLGMKVLKKIRKKS